MPLVGCPKAGERRDSTRDIEAEDGLSGPRSERPPLWWQLDTV